MVATNQYIAKFFRLKFFIIALALCSQPSFCEESEIGINEEIAKQYKSYINEFQRIFGKQIEREFNLILREENVFHDFFPNSIKFYAYRRASLEEARALELSVLNKLAEEIHADPKMLSYLSMLSLTPDSIAVAIRFVYLHQWSYRDGSIDDVNSSYSKIGNKNFRKQYLKYTTSDPFSDYSAYKDETFSTHFEESFEDAVKLNAASPNINPTIHELTGFEDELNQILTSFKKEMQKKYGLLFESSGWMIAGKSTPDITEIRAKCTYLYPLSCEEARALILLATEKLLTTLNNSETLRPYLKEYPFSANRLKLRMLFRKEKLFVGDVPYYDGSMESAVLSGNFITYYYHIPKDSSMHDRVIYTKESYQEAQKILENTMSSTAFEKIFKRRKNFTFNFNSFLDIAFMLFMFLLAIIFNSWLLIIPAIIIFSIIFIFRLICRHSKQN